ncbi:receptor-like protein 7 [Vigna unguiculata]|uniref:receptor-like protein 7 n=1 Tax=Vigna unguiculata TaxID=3917 RepID=UPI001015E7B8|nr:receptor-like protein 7 [Vigna unguiculata]XP_027907103.1 receptor-like protein 7 [Vigna unguiculata]
MRTELVSALVVMSLFWLCLSNNLFVVSGLCHDDQRSLLLQLKNNLTFTFQRSTKLKSWNLTNDCCGWIGVSCDKKGHVTALDLSRETITGGIDDSSSLFSLQHLRILNLADNNLHSVIPSAFKRMENLTYLNLSYAGFVGQIPIEISQMIRLITLDLSCFPNFGLKLQNPDLRKLVQNLTSIRQLYLDGVTISAAGHEWSSVLMSLHDLQEVRMSDCDLSGPLDPSLSRHESLSVILLEGNNLSSAVPETFADFKFLTILSLFDCQLTGTFPQKIFNIGTLLAVDVAWNHNLQGFFPDFPLGSLHTLIVSNTRFSGAFPRSFGNMRNLSHLDFSYCQFNGTIPNSLSNLTELTFLVLSYNNFTGQIPSFNMANKLTVLDLSYNGLSGSIPSSYFEGLNNLVSIYLCFNSISGSIPSSLFTLPQLKTIMLSNNRFFQLDEFTNVSSSKLTNLDLSSNNISGPFPKSIYQLSGLVLLVLSSNKLNGTMHLNKPSEFRNLALLDLSYNNLSVEGNVTNDDTSYFPSIEDLQLVSCNLNRFPGFLRNHSEINYLDLSDNHIHGIIPNWIWKLPLAELDISHNLLTYSEGPLRNFSSNLNILDLHDNEIQGQIPFIPTDMEYLDFSRNTFRGGIPDSLCNASSLCLLDLSDNNISGTIPSCLLEMGRNLEVLNLRKNNVMGPVPGKISSDCSLMTLDLHQNKLDGKIPKSLSNCTSLQVLDLGQNKIRDVFPCLLKDISTLLVLVLRENNLYGHIGCPNTNATWPVLQILDLAINNFSGKLPQTVFTRWEATVSHENQPAYTVKRIHYDFYRLGRKWSKIYYYDSVTVTMKGQQRDLVKILSVFTSIDFSSNHFEGEIPKQLFDFKELYALNLSNNAFSGQISPSIRNLKELESLDLSNNSFEGNIPSELASLSFLSFLNLSSNHLVGKIPTGTQLQSFPASSFQGNDGLYGPPLTDEFDGRQPGVLQQHQTLVSTVGWNFLSVELGLIFGHGMIFGPLLFWKQWRIWYWQLINKILCWIFSQLYLEYATKRGQTYITLRWQH